MTAVWIVVGLVVGLALGAAVGVAADRRRSDGRRRAADSRSAEVEASARAVADVAEGRASSAEGRAAAEARRADEAERRVTEASERAEAERDRAERAERRERTEVTLAAAAAGTIDAAWSLAALRVVWDLRRAAALVPAMAAQDEVDLVAAVRAEVDRVREEIGTPGLLEADELPHIPAPVSLLALLALGALLAALARRTEAYDAALSCHEGHLRADVTCDADDGIVIDDADLADVVAAVAAAGADLHLRRRSDGRFSARLEIPLH